jgi:uncharacterized protein
MSSTSISARPATAEFHPEFVAPKVENAVAAVGATFAVVSDPVPVHPGLLSESGEPRLLGSRCRTCGGHHFPRHETCAYCSSEDVEAVELSARGHLWAWTAVTSAPPGYDGPVPYGFGVVELPEGLRVITRLTEADPGRLTRGQPMHLVVTDLTTDDEGSTVTVPAFAPDGALHS